MTLSESRNSSFIPPSNYKKLLSDQSRPSQFCFRTSNFNSMSSNNSSSNNKDWWNYNSNSNTSNHSNSSNSKSNNPNNSSCNNKNSIMEKSNKRLTIMGLRLFRPSTIKKRVFQFMMCMKTNWVRKMQWKFKSIKIKLNKKS